MKIYVRAPFSDRGLKELKQLFDEVVYDPWTTTGERFYEDEMLAKLQEIRPDAFITELDRITEKVLQEYDGLKFIGDCRGTPANLDVDACSAHGIPILCTPGRNTQAVAEMVVGLVLTYYRRIIPAVQWVQEGKWTQGTTPYYLWMGNELHGKKVGFVGFGRISGVVSGIFKAFGCDISYYDPFVTADDPSFHKKTIEEVFRDSDIVTLHLPVLESTKGMITRELLESMKPDALFVNAARSALVDYDALEDVLRDHKIRGAIIDVLGTEPPEEEDLRIGKLDNVLLTPHICGATYEVTDHQSDILLENIRDWKDGRDPEHSIYNYAKLKESADADSSGR